MQHPGLLEVARQDPRYAYEAYEFLFEALGHTQKLLGRAAEPTPTEQPSENHVSGPELVTGFLDLAQRKFGRMARVVLHLWGIDRTDDIGTIVFNLIDANLLSKTDRDQRDDFHDLLDLDDVLLHRFEIKLEQSD